MKDAGSPGNVHKVKHQYNIKWRILEPLADHNFSTQSEWNDTKILLKQKKKGETYLKFCLFHSLSDADTFHNSMSKGTHYNAFLDICH